MTKVYTFSLGPTVCSAIETEAVLAAFGGREPFERFFGGAMTFGPPSSPDYLGVWGARKASRLRRLVGMVAVLHHLEGPPPSRLTSALTFRRPSKRQRRIAGGVRPGR